MLTQKAKLPCIHFSYALHVFLQHSLVQPAALKINNAQPVIRDFLLQILTK
jgi:hypothetical protein